MGRVGRRLRTQDPLKGAPRPAYKRKRERERHPTDPASRLLFMAIPSFASAFASRAGSPKPLARPGPSLVVHVRAPVRPCQGALTPPDFQTPPYSRKSFRSCPVVSPAMSCLPREKTRLARRENAPKARGARPGRLAPASFAECPSAKEGEAACRGRCGEGAAPTPQERMAWSKTGCYPVLNHAALSPRRPGSSRSTSRGASRARRGAHRDPDDPLDRLRGDNWNHTVVAPHEAHSRCTAPEDREAVSPSRGHGHKAGVEVDAYDLLPPAYNTSCRNFSIPVSRVRPRRLAVKRNPAGRETLQVFAWQGFAKTSGSCSRPVPRAEPLPRAAQRTLALTIPHRAGIAFVRRSVRLGDTGTESRCRVNASSRPSSKLRAADSLAPPRYRTTDWRAHFDAAPRGAPSGGGRLRAHEGPKAPAGLALVPGRRGGGAKVNSSRSARSRGRRSWGPPRRLRRPVGAASVRRGKARSACRRRP